MTKAGLSIYERFWTRVLGVEDGCWDWKGSRKETGYGKLSITPTTVRTAHQMAWEFAFGPIPEGKWVLHHCDNPACVRPSHLFLGDRSVNMKDAYAKGRTNFQLYPQHRGRGPQKLDWPQVREIRRKYQMGDVTYVSLAKEFGVSPTQVRAIIKGYAWPQRNDPANQAATDAA